jgi:hypothetical protein
MTLLTWSGERRLGLLVAICYKLADYLQSQTA